MGVAERMRSLMERVQRDNHKPVAWVLGQADYDEFRVWLAAQVAEYVAAIEGVGIPLESPKETLANRTTFVDLPVLYSTRPACIELLVEPRDGADFPEPYVTGALTTPSPHPLTSTLLDIASTLRKLDLTIQRVARGM